MGARSILIKVVFFIRWFPFHAGLGPLLMAVRRGRRSAAAAEVKTCTPPCRTEVGAKPPPVPIPVRGQGWIFIEVKLYGR